MLTFFMNDADRVGRCQPSSRTPNWLMKPGPPPPVVDLVIASDSQLPASFAVSAYVIKHAVYESELPQFSDVYAG